MNTYIFKPLVLTIGLLASCVAYAQETNDIQTTLITPSEDYRKHEIGATYGVLTSNTLVHFLGLFFEEVFDGNDDYDYENFSAVPLRLNYKYSISKRWQIGVGLTNEKISNDVLKNDSYHGKMQVNYLTVALETQFKYIKKSHFQMYSGLGLGITYRSVDFDASNSSNDFLRNTSYPAAQLTLLGFRFGDQIGAHFEIGAGYIGVINMGVSARF